MSKTVVITGANSGIGFETTKELARQGWMVKMICRNPQKAKTAAQQIKTATNHTPEIFIADLTLMKDVKIAAQKILNSTPTIDCLINNAGSLTQGRKLSAEGWEYSMAINFLAPYFLSRLLLPNILRSENGKIINVISAAYTRYDFQLEKLNEWSNYEAYSNTKLANVLFSIELAKRYEGNLLVNCADPGPVNTGFGGNIPWYLKMGIALVRPFLKSARQGAEPSIFLATTSEKYQAKYFNSQQPQEFKISKEVLEQAPLLWDKAEELLKPYFDFEKN